MSIRDDSPAFPVPDTYHPNGQVEYGATGMTLRDYFAAQVLIGLSIQRKGLTDEHDARNAYSLADAMLKEREAQR
jgi:hypothetical protein